MPGATHNFIYHPLLIFLRGKHCLCSLTVRFSLSAAERVWIGNVLQGRIIYCILCNYVDYNTIYFHLINNIDFLTDCCINDTVDTSLHINLVATKSTLNVIQKSAPQPPLVPVREEVHTHKTTSHLRRITSSWKRFNLNCGLVVYQKPGPTFTIAGLILPNARVWNDQLLFPIWK